MSEWDYPIKDILLSIRRYLHIYFYRSLTFLNRKLLKTYPLIEDCARCDDCGRNVHDFIVPDKLWIAIWGNEKGILCYDCFCNRADEKFRFKWRMELVEKWHNLKEEQENEKS